MNAAQSSRRRSWNTYAGVGSTALLGLAAIVGSGGGGGLSDICSGNSCSVIFPAVQVTPHRITVQVGTAVRFSAQVSDVTNPTYQWQRSNAGMAFVDIPSATGESYTLPGATLLDDGATFQLKVFSGPTLVARDSALLTVSSMPSMNFQDTEFSLADWSATLIADATSAGAGHAENQTGTGGNPGAYRDIAFALPAGPSMETVVYLNRAVQYDPAVDGAIHAVDYSEDCRDVPVGTSTQHAPFGRVAFQQGIRFFASKAEFYCNSYAWTTEAYPSLTLGDFVQLSGPACAVGESCPDFSGSGQVIKLGFARRAALAASEPAATIKHDADNWSVHIWRQ